MADDIKTPRAKVCKKTFAHDEGGAISSLTFTFANEVQKKITLLDFSLSVLARATWHGLSAKLGDAYAAAKSDVNQAIELWTDTFDTLQGDNGSWFAEGESVGPRIGDLAQAIAKIRPDKYTTETAAAMLALLTKEERAQRAAIPQVKAAVLEIRAARALALAATIHAGTDATAEQQALDAL